MSTFLAILCVGLTLGVLGGVGGFAAGLFWERSQWNALKKVAIAGQTVWVQGIGDVLVLGYSEDESTLDYVKLEDLGDRKAHEVDGDELNGMTWSLPVQQFLSHVAPDSVVQAARI